MNVLKLARFQPHLVRSVQSFARNINPLYKEINESRIIGTVVNVSQLYRNSLTILLRTYDDKQFYEIHKVSIPPSLVKKTPSIAVRQKLCIFGRLRLERFKKDDGSIGSEFEIKAHQIYVCDIDGRTGTNRSISQSDDVTKKNKVTTALNSDMNKAQIFSQISFEVINKVKFSSFCLASNYFSFSVQGNVQRVDFIPIHVYDSELRDYVRNNLKRLDRVRIEGVLKNQPKTDDKGKKRMMGYIQAHSIRKMLPLHAADDQINTIKNRKQL